MHLKILKIKMNSVLMFYINFYINYNKINIYSHLKSP